MQFPESWLRQFCNPPLTTQQLADTLTMAGLEVEELQPVAPPFSHIVVGEIKEAVQHPNADRLRVCQVDVGQTDAAGQSQLLNIVCGAPNARVGIRIPCALVGAELPPGDDGQPFKIKLGKLRGVESQGMLCSARELKLSEDHGGLMELPLDAPLGQNIRDFLNLDDTLFTLKLTPNLAHCLSVYGVARELSALTDTPLMPLTPLTPSQNADVATGHNDVLPVKVSAPDLCGRFSGRIVRGVNPKAKTPQWMVDRLARCGQRAVTPLVDISNYVMFESGQPTHIFDLDKIQGGLSGSGTGLEVRWARAGETLKLLNGNTITLDETVGVIADSQAVESLAGIMGGDATAVSDDTQNIYIEAAFWWPKAVAGRSRRFNFSTDAGHRFERGVDPALTVQIIERITQLVQAICGGEAGPITDVQPNRPLAQAVPLRVARAAKIIGMPVTEAQCVQALQRLGLKVEQGGQGTPAGAEGLEVGTLMVTPPSYRFDITLEEDLIEEVVRLVGFENLPTTKPLAPISPKLPAENTRSPFAVRRALAALGYQETINFSFVEAAWEHELAGNPNPIQLLNPIASQMSVMRSSLMGSLLQVLKFNTDRKAARVRVFELGRVFLRDDKVQDSLTTVAGFHQPMRLAGLAFGPRAPLQWSGKETMVDFFDVKGELENLLSTYGKGTLAFVPATHPALHPGRTAEIKLNGLVIGVVGELHPKWRQQWGFSSSPILFELELDAVLARRVAAFQSVSRLQPVSRDLALVVGEAVPYALVEAAILEAPHQGLLRDVTLFDVYRPANTAEKSFAVRLSLQSEDATLTDEQIDSVVQAVIKHLAERTGARLRA